MVKSCSECKKGLSCDILGKIKWLINTTEWGCSDWMEEERNVFLADPGERLYSFHLTHPEILIRHGLTEDDFLSDHIDPKYLDSVCVKISTIDEHIALIFIPEEKKYVFMNRLGIREYEPILDKE